MAKKEYILKLLTALENSWEVAPGLKLLVEGDYLTENIIDHLTEIMKKAVHIVHDELTKKKLEKGVTFLEKLKAAEANEQAKDKKDIEELDSLLNTI